jgi:hypothetical protein
MLRFTLVGVSILLLLSCSNDDPWAPDVEDIQRTEVYVTNVSAERILEVYLRQAGTEAWGANWIVQPIAGGDLYAHLGAVLSGRFDVRMVGELTTEETLDLNLVGDAIGIAFHAPPIDPAGGRSRSGGSRQ